jgi:hypothetical protein
MKLKVLKGVVYNACDKVRSSPFQMGYLNKLEMPSVGRWVIDLKNNLSKNDLGKNIDLPFKDEFHKWFLKELEKANIPIDEIDLSRLILEFDFENNRPIICSCEIKSNEKRFYHVVKFRLF